ncbi:hypothetical protein [Bacillus subtilis]
MQLVDQKVHRKTGHTPLRWRK